MLTSKPSILKRLLKYPRWTYPASLSPALRVLGSQQLTAAHTSAKFYNTVPKLMLEEKQNSRSNDGLFVWTEALKRLSTTDFHLCCNLMTMLLREDPEMGPFEYPL